MPRSVKRWKFSDSEAFYVLLTGVFVSVFLPLVATSAQEEKTVNSDRFTSAALPLSDIVYDPDDMASTKFMSMELGSPVPPGDFAKLDPADGSTGKPSSLRLDWESSSNADSYEYCIDLTNNNACGGDQ